MKKTIALYIAFIFVTLFALTASAQNDSNTQPKPPA